MTDLIKPMAEFSVEGPLKSISFDIGSYNVVISESIVVQWIVMLVLGIVFFAGATWLLYGFARKITRDADRESASK